MWLIEVRINQFPDQSIHAGGKIAEDAIVPAGAQVARSPESLLLQIVLKVTNRQFARAESKLVSSEASLAGTGPAEMKCFDSPVSKPLHGAPHNERVAPQILEALIARAEFVNGLPAKLEKDGSGKGLPAGSRRGIVRSSC